MPTLKITGKVIDSRQNNLPLANAQVFISNENGTVALNSNFDTNSALGTRTNSEGNFELQIPYIIDPVTKIPIPTIFGSYITAKVLASETLQSSKKVTLPLNLAGQKVYNFDISDSGMSRDIRGVPVVDFKPTGEVTTASALPTKKSLWWVWVLLGASAIGGYIYFSKKAK